MSSSTVEIDGHKIAIEAISGWKFLEASEIIANITEAAPEIFKEVEDFTQARIKAGEKVYTRAAALAAFADQGLDKLPEEQWAAMGQEITLPGPRPTGPEQVAQVLPHALRVARPLVCRLLAVLAVPNGELEQAEGDETKVNEIVKVWENRLLFNGRVRDLIKVAVMGVEAFRAEATEDEEVRELMGKLAALLPGAAQAAQEAVGAQEAAAQQPTEPSEKSPNSTSSTDSQTPSDGSPDGSSSDLDGESSGDLESASTSAT